MLSFLSCYLGFPGLFLSSFVPVIQLLWQVFCWWKNTYFLKLLLRYFSQTSNLLGGKRRKECHVHKAQGRTYHFFVVWTEEWEPLKRISFHFLIYTAIY